VIDDVQSSSALETVFVYTQLAMACVVESQNFLRSLASRVFRSNDASRSSVVEGTLSVTMVCARMQIRAYAQSIARSSCTYIVKLRLMMWGAVEMEWLVMKGVTSKILSVGIRVGACHIWC
jgi:hypothetical protein